MPAAAELEAVPVVAPAVPVVVPVVVVEPRVVE
jgi:hypothetical protein